MTIEVRVTHNTRGTTDKIRVFRCTLGTDSMHVEDPIVLGPGESADFTIWGDVRLAVEEEPPVA